MEHYIREKYFSYFHDDYYDYTEYYSENVGWLADGEHIKYKKYELDFTRGEYNITIPIPL